MNIPTILALFIATVSFVSSSNVSPDNHYPSSKVDTEFLRHLAPKNDKGGGGKPPQESGDFTFTNWSPAAESTLTDSSNVLRAEVYHDTSGIKVVFIEVSFQNGAYSSDRVRGSGQQGDFGEYYELELSNMLPGAYSWRVRAQNNNRVEATSDTITFAIEGKRK